MRTQSGADAGSPAFTYYVNPISVVMRNLRLYGFVGPFQIAPKVTFGVDYKGKRYDVTVSQPGAFSPTSIWVVTRIVRHASASTGAPASPVKTATPLPGQPHLGVVSHTPAQLSQIQTGVNAHNAALQYYLNPAQVVIRNLPRYGFTGPFTLRPRVTVLVTYRLVQYDVRLDQPASHGAHGIWLVTRIKKH